MQPSGLASIPQPVPGRGEVLVKVAASGVNPLGIKIRAAVVAHARHPFPAILGIDLAGTVAALGPGVATFREGDEVHGMTAVSAACRDRSPNMLLSTRSPASAMWSARSDGRRIRSRRSLSVPAPILAYSRCCRSSAANAARITGKSYARRPNSSKLRFDPRRFNLSNVDAAHASVDDRSAKGKILVEFQ